MVATAMHYLIGVLIAWFFGIRSNKKFFYGLWAVAPDIDSLLMVFRFLVRRAWGLSLDYGWDAQWQIVLFSHRGFSHSLLLLGIVLCGVWVWKKDKRFVMMIGCLWGSHLLLDYLTSWKIFLFLPFSYSFQYLGLVEVFDSWLVVLTMILFGFFVGESLVGKEKKRMLYVAYLLVFLFGFVPSVFMNEFNVQTLVVSQALFFGIVWWFYGCKNMGRKLAAKGIRCTTVVIICYLGILLLTKGFYAASLGTSIRNVEPLEEFAFNYNGHTFEIDQGNTYRIGVISLRGIEEEGVVAKINDTTGKMEAGVIGAYVDAYSKALPMNWINHPVFTFYEGGGKVYAIVRYAKNFLHNPHMPGPNRGIRVTLEKGMLVQDRR
jgi:membrane-bound metal-dependent hydrolase YbcI (DUF457 family)